MLEKILRTTEKLIPKKLYKLGQPVYHWLLALTGALLYRFPAKKIKVVAITGTKGKTTTSELANSVLEAAGFKTALANGIRFKIGDTSERNLYKMSTPGRFFMQRFLRQAVDQKCDWAVLEITSEAAKQFRHKWISLDAFIFTNLSPEHIESHGSFENYKAAKLAITESLDPAKTKKETYMFLNGDDAAAEDFMQQAADYKIMYLDDDIQNFESTDSGLTAFIRGVPITSSLHGKFNAKNMAGVIAFAQAIGIEPSVIATGISNLPKVPGRAEKIIDDPFDVYVDYAHTPDSLKALYESFPEKKKICVLGNTGGGRDTWKRPEMAKIADHYCDAIILTDEDPYDEDPQKIVDEMKVAITNKPLEVIMDRRQAIHTAMQQASEGSVVLVTGKGTDPYIMRANGTKEPWSDAEVVREEFQKL